MAAISAESKKKKDQEMANLESSGITAYSVLGTKQNNTRKKDRLFPGTKFACFRVKS